MRKLAISNIAWTSSEDASILPKLKAWGIRGLEVAPTRLFQHPDEASESEAGQVRESVEAHGLAIIAMQSLLYGRPDLELFGTQASRVAMMHYLKKMVNLATVLGAKTLVFGNPKNRLRRGLPIDEARKIALPFFRELGAYASERDIWVCIEANAPQYGCDFVTHTLEAHRFVQEVDQDGFGLHLDTSTMFYNGEDISEILSTCLPFAKHFHLSAPLLAPLIQEKMRFASIAENLRFFKDHQGWISMEMSKQNDCENSDTVMRSAQFIGGLFSDD